MVRPDLGARLLLEDEHQRLSRAQLFYVTADITRLVRQAAPSLKNHWDTQPQDIPAPTGFMLFAEPLADYVREDGKRIDVVAVSWGGTELFTSDTGGLWVTFWSATDFAPVKRLARSLGASAAEAELTAHQQNANSPGTTRSTCRGVQRRPRWHRTRTAGRSGQISSSPPRRRSGGCRPSTPAGFSVLRTR
ncbi:hypothetical protein [Amycolatopsis plumensis]|uniref:Uncharacterized protein n=1 Tax=Amycolatopsis plumensis TaxID=236508 RepID=A0ABV5U5B5_9PSEU